MKIGSAQPYSVEWHIGVTRGLMKVRKTLRIRLIEPPVLLVSGVESTLVRSDQISIGVEAVPVGPYLVNCHHGAYKFVFSRRRIAERGIACAVAGGAVLRINRRSLLGELWIDRIRIGKGFSGQQPVPRAQDELGIERRRIRSGTERRGEIAFIH